MQFTQAGIPLSFEVTYDAPDLFVAMEVWDVSGVSPALVDTLPMANLSGNTYYAKFTPVAGKTYVVNKAAYTDDTYSTRDGVHAEGSESFTARDIAALVLDVLMSDHIEMGSVGEAIQKASGGYISQGNPIIGIVEVEDEL